MTPLPSLFSSCHPLFLQNYQHTLLQRAILPSAQIHALFINLDSLVEFQQRFLIGIVANAHLAPDQQRFGRLFTSLKDSFSCYERFCANFASASQIALNEDIALTVCASLVRLYQHIFTDLCLFLLPLTENGRYTGS